MHCLFLIGFLVIVIVLCQAAPDKPFVHVSGGNGGDASGSKNGADGSIQYSSGNSPSGNFMKHDKYGNSMQADSNRVVNDVKGGRNSADSIRYHVIVPFLLGILLIAMRA